MIVQGVPEFESSDLRRSCSMTRKTSIKVYPQAIYPQSMLTAVRCSE